MSRATAALFAIVSTALFAQLAEFEVASVRLHAIGAPGSYPPRGGVGTDDPERIVYNGFTLGALLLDAFDVKHSWRILGPDWLNGDLERYDVIAIGTHRTDILKTGLVGQSGSQPRQRRDSSL